jgi:molybdopterin synthase catalytic subunit
MESAPMPPSTRAPDRGHDDRGSDHDRVDGHEQGHAPDQGDARVQGHTRDHDRDHDRVKIQPEDFDLGAEVAALRHADGGVGAVVSFIGTVRERSEGADVTAMELEHYPGMTERSIESMIDAASARFDIRAVRIIHRVGLLQAREQIVLVAVSSSHRASAFSACEFLMDYLKTRAPFWKKEHTPDGTRWVDARSSDDAARERWNEARK